MVRLVTVCRRPVTPQRPRHKDWEALLGAVRLNRSSLRPDAPAPTRQSRLPLVVTLEPLPKVWLSCSTQARADVMVVAPSRLAATRKERRIALGLRAQFPSCMTRSLSRCAELGAGCPNRETRSTSNT